MPDLCKCMKWGRDEKHAIKLALGKNADKNGMAIVHSVVIRKLKSIKRIDNPLSIR